MTTKEAYVDLITHKELWERTGKTDAARRVLKSRALAGQWPTIDFMEEHLELAGVHGVIQEKRWGRKR
jgi:hypothetical protein